MVNIQVSKGLDIPIKGKPELPTGEMPVAKKPEFIALDLREFQNLKFKLLVKPGDVVLIGQPLAEDKATPGRMFVSPAAGTIVDIKRGLKRVLLSIVIQVAPEEKPYEHPHSQIIETLKNGGAFSKIRVRPFNLLANPEVLPRSIFVKAVETAPFVPASELQVVGHEKAFQSGLDALATLAPVHLVHAQNSPLRAFSEAKNVQRHTVEGPHPAGNASVHIHYIDPIKSNSDVVWTVNAHDVVLIGYLIGTGKYFTDRVITIAGPGVLPGRTGYIKAREGYPIRRLTENRLPHADFRIISGDPLTGVKVENEDYLGFSDYCLTIIPETTERQLLHFFRLGLNKYSFSGAYMSGHLNNAEREYDFTTSQHGEHRAFIDASLYAKVMPIPIPTMHLVKAVMAEDYDLAEQLGLMEVDSEDFALPAFVCPSKMEMVEIIKLGLRQYAKEVLK